MAQMGTEASSFRTGFQRSLQDGEGGRGRDSTVLFHTLPVTGMCSPGLVGPPCLNLGAAVNILSFQKCLAPLLHNFP